MFWWRLFTKSYGTYCVMWNYGSGKTSGTFLDLTSYDKNKTYIIANVPYSFVDKMYDTPEELNLILRSIINYCKITNKDIKKYYDERFKYKDIVLIVDEAHRYFDARNWKMYSDELDVVLSQCRKRNIQVFFISQRLKRLDINIRRLSDFIVRYRKFRKPILPWSEFVNRFIYSNEWDLADIQGDDAKTYIMNGEQKKSELDDALITKSLFLPLFKLFGFIPFKTGWGKLSSEYYNTLYICGLDCKFVNVNDPFLKDILVKTENWEIPQSKNEKVAFKIERIIPTFYSIYKKLNAKWYYGSNSLQEWDANLRRSSWGVIRVIKPRNWFILEWGRTNDVGELGSNVSNNNGWWSGRPQIKPAFTIRTKSLQ